MAPSSAISNQNSIRPAHDSRMYDLLMASPQIAFSSFAVAGFAIVIPQQWCAASANGSFLFSEAVTAIFLGMQLVLVCIRRLPIRKVDGFFPKAWAFVAANLGYALLLIPRANLGQVMVKLSTFIVVAGTLGSMIALIYLGRAFAILPQARMLVRSGPYAYVRHPLYLFEQLAMLGIALQYHQPWGLILVAVSFAMQFPRMRYEVQVLRETFSEYDAYASVTPRLIPFVSARTHQQSID
jgi:protein-S-isoprenylcysteine O-methyltransferase Ste14